MDCVKPVRLTKNLCPHEFPDGLLVPCGKCISCRIQKRREWSMRCLHETYSFSDTIFVTLTYNDISLPYESSEGSLDEGSEWPTLRKVHLQRFYKKLRKKLRSRKIKHFSCGEYGEQSGRPHYHCIIFGMSLAEEDKELIKSCWSYADWEMLGTAPWGLAEAESIRYTCQYVDKKFSGGEYEEEYIKKRREPVFKVNSNGLGLKYAMDNKRSIQVNGYITMNGVRMSIPRYYIKKLDLDINEIQEKAVQKEREYVKKVIGKELTRDEAYHLSSLQEIYALEERIKDGKNQHARNLKAKLNLRTKGTV